MTNEKDTDMTGGNGNGTGSAGSQPPFATPMTAGTNPVPPEMTGLSTVTEEPQQRRQQGIAEIFVNQQKAQAQGTAQGRR